MTAKEIISVIAIHILIPCLGLVYFMQICKKMKNENIINPPIYELFLAFLSYGGLILVVFTDLFWQWSGMASLGMLYLILVAPFVNGIITYTLRQSKKVSKYHKWTYYAGLLYFIIAPITFGLLFLFRKHSL